MHSLVAIELRQREGAAFISTYGTFRRTCLFLKYFFTEIPIKVRGAARSEIMVKN